MKDINICKTNYSHFFQDLDLTLKIQKIKYISHSLLLFYLFFLTFSIQSCRSCYATQHLCQRSFYKIFVKFRHSKNNVLKIVLIIENINKDENKSLILNQFSLKSDFSPTSWRTILRR